MHISPYSIQPLCIIRIPLADKRSLAAEGSSFNVIYRGAVYTIYDGVMNGASANKARFILGVDSFVD